MRFILFIILFFISTNVFSKTFLLSHENITLGDIKEEVLKKIKVLNVSEHNREPPYPKIFPNVEGRPYTSIRDFNYYEIGGIKFGRRFEFEEDRLVSIKLSVWGLEFLNEDELKINTQKLLNLFFKKGKTLTNDEPELSEKKLKNQGQTVGLLGTAPSESDCYYDGENTKETSYIYNLNNSKFIFEHRSSPCYPHGNGFQNSYTIIYKLDFIGSLIEEERKIIQSKF